MKLREEYDWIVLGDHPGALLSAGLAARLGQSVLILDSSHSRRFKKGPGDRILDFESNLVLGLGRTPRFSGLVHECLSRLGLPAPDLESVRMSEPFPQVLTRGMRVDFARSLKAEFSREMKPELSSRLGLIEALSKLETEILPFWLHLPERLTILPGKNRQMPASLRWQEVIQKVERSTSDEQVSRWLSPQFRFSDHSELYPLLEGWVQSVLGQSEWASPLYDGRLDARSALHVLALGMTSASFRGGLSRYRELLLKLAQSLGAHVPPKGECRRVFIDQGKLIGVQVAHVGNMIGAGGAVSGMSLTWLDQLANVGGRSWTKKLKTSPARSGWKFTVAYLVARDAIPPGATPWMIWKDVGGPHLEIEITRATDYGVIQKDRVLVFARTVLPFSAESLDISFQKRVSAKILRQISSIFPYFERHIETVYPDLNRVAGNPDARDEGVYAFKSLSEIPENLHVISANSTRGVGADSGIEGLFLASDESYPELGSMGGAVAAIESVSWLAHRAGLVGPLA